MCRNMNDTLKGLVTRAAHHDSSRTISQMTRVNTRRSNA